MQRQWGLGYWNGIVLALALSVLAARCSDDNSTIDDSTRSGDASADSSSDSGQFEASDDDSGFDSSHDDSGATQDDSGAAETGPSCGRACGAGCERLCQEREPCEAQDDCVAGLRCKLEDNGLECHD